MGLRSMKVRDLQEKVGTGAATCKKKVCTGAAARKNTALKTSDFAITTDSLSPRDSLGSATDSLPSKMTRGSSSLHASRSSSDLLSPSFSISCPATPSGLHHSKMCVVTPRQAVVREPSLMTAPAHVVRSTSALASSPISTPLVLNRNSVSPASVSTSVRVSVSVQLGAPPPQSGLKHSVAVSTGLPSARDQLGSAKLAWTAGGV